MLTVSLHGIRINAPVGLYEEELLTGNVFEVDVDIHLEAGPDAASWPFVDYAEVRSIVADHFVRPGKLLEEFVAGIYAALKERFSGAGRIRVAVRKYHPPMPGEVRYASVCFEK